MSKIVPQENTQAVALFFLQSLFYLLQDLESWLAGAGSTGVIYFSLGSVIRSESMPPEYHQAFLEAFRRLPQRVLWKYERELEGASDNVRVSSWLPQQDILGKSARSLQ